MRSFDMICRALGYSNTPEQVTSESKTSSHHFCGAGIQDNRTSPAPPALALASPPGQVCSLTCQQGRQEPLRQLVAPSVLRRARMCYMYKLQPCTRSKGNCLRAGQDMTMDLFKGRALRACRARQCAAKCRAQGFLAPNACAAGNVRRAAYYAACGVGRAPQWSRGTAALESNKPRGPW